MESPFYEMTHNFEEENYISERAFQSGYLKGYHDALMKMENKPQQAELRGHEYFCPRCKNHVEMMHAGEFNNYCSFCGQKLEF